MPQLTMSLPLRVSAPRAPRRSVVFATLLVLLALAAIPSAASARVSQGFAGVTLEGPLYPDTDAHLSLTHEMDRMVASGVESVRATFNWSSAQPYASWSDVPASKMGQFVAGPGNVPTDFTITDQLVTLAAQHRLSVLPVVVYAPFWDRTGGRLQPANNGPYAQFLTALIARYGPNGSFWASHPQVPRQPIRAWQVWNEPDVSLYWTHPENFQPSYVALLKAAHDAIKHADPGATVVLAGMPNYSWEYLKGIYRIKGARSLFDVVAVHPYTNEPAGVVSILYRVRQVMNSYGDGRKSILASEIGWPSALYQSHQKYGYKTTEAGQASKTAALLPMLAGNRSRLRLMGFDYETWMNTEYHEAPSFNFSGLVKFTKSGKALAKPALTAYRNAALAMERCRRKGAQATACLH